MLWLVRGAVLWLIKSWKFIIGGLIALPVLAAAIGVILKAWRWLVDCHDAPVLRYFQDCARRCRLAVSPRPLYPPPPTISEIASYVKRSEKSVHKSLLRLERKEKLVETKRGWELPNYRLPF
jgi:hypothetical protein